MGPVDQLEDRHLRKVEATGSKEGLRPLHPCMKKEGKGEGVGKARERAQPI